MHIVIKATDACCRFTNINAFRFIGTAWSTFSFIDLSGKYPRHASNADDTSMADLRRSASDIYTIEHSVSHIILKGSGAHLDPKMFTAAASTVDVIYWHTLRLSVCFDKTVPIYWHHHFCNELDHLIPFILITYPQFIGAH